MAPMWHLQLEKIAAMNESIQTKKMQLIIAIVLGLDPSISFANMSSLMPLIVILSIPITTFICLDSNYKMDQALFCKMCSLRHASILSLHLIH